MNFHGWKPTLISSMTAIFGFAIVSYGYADELVEFSAPLNVEYENPNADYSQFDRLIIEELDLSDTLIVPPPWLAEKAFEWKTSDKNRAHLQKEFLASMNDQISANGGYEIVGEPGPGVLQLSVKVVSFMPYAEQKDTKAVTLGSGEMRIHVELRDSQTGELLGMYEGPQEVGKEYQKNTDFTKQKNVKKLFDSWGRRVRLAMDGDRQG